MKAVICRISERQLEERRRSGADQWDEMWDGVLHMPPSRNRYHQGLEFELENWLRDNWAARTNGRVYHQINVASPGGWPDRDYRIPDLVLLTPDRFHIDRIEYFDGAPTVVVEIHSPGDEAYEKMTFYADMGVPEVWIIHRDTKVPELYVPAGNEYRLAGTNADGWLVSAATGVEMKASGSAKLVLRIADDHRTQEAIPKD